LEVLEMARRCELTGTQPQSGHNVSHSNRKTKRVYAPNLQKASLFSTTLRLSVPLRITTRALRSVQRHGGIDAYLLNTSDARLAPEGLRLKRRIKKILTGVPKRA
jgi:large subunit ribosomal protein L28